MKKIFLLSVLCPLLLGVAVTSNSVFDSNVIKEESFEIYSDRVNGVDGKILTGKSLVLGDNQLSYSKVFTQHGINPDSGNSYLRFASAIKGDISSLNYTLTYKEEVKTVEINTVYRGISADGSTYYYGENGLTTNSEESTHYFACFTLEFKSDAELDTVFTANLNVVTSDNVEVSGLPNGITLNQVKYENPYDYNVLVLGMDLLGSYCVSTFLPALCEAEDGVNLNYVECLSGTYTFKSLGDENNNYGKKFRNQLALNQFDAIIIQISRRITESATDVIASELNELKALYPLLHQETSNIKLLAYNTDAAAPSVFTVDESGDYVKTDAKETGWTTKKSGGVWYAQLSEIWANEINSLNSDYNLKPLKYSLVYNTSSGPKDSTVGYMLGASMYMSLFGKTYENTSILNEVPQKDSDKVSTMTVDAAKKIRGWAEEHILGL